MKYDINKLEQFISEEHQDAFYVYDGEYTTQSKAWDMLNHIAMKGNRAEFTKAVKLLQRDPNYDLEKEEKEPANGFIDVSHTDLRVMTLRDITRIEERLGELEAKVNTNAEQLGDWLVAVEKKIERLDNISNGNEVRVTDIHKRLRKIDRDYCKCGGK